MGGGDSRPHPDPSPEYEPREVDGQEEDAGGGEQAAPGNPDGTTLPEFKRGSEVGAGSGYGGGDAAGRDGASSAREASESDEDGKPSADRTSGEGFPLRLFSDDGPDEAVRMFAARSTARLGQSALRSARNTEEEVQEVSEEIARASWRFVVGEEEESDPDR